MKLYLLRHTRPAIAQGVCYGQADVAVTADFPEALQEIRKKLAGIEFGAVYSSPLSRCYKLADALAPDRVVIDARLLELNFGLWELKKWDEIPRVEFDAWAHDFQTLGPPGGESLAELQARAQLFVAELQMQHAQQSVLAVTHGGLVRVLLAQALNLPLGNLFQLEVDYGSVTQLNYDGMTASVGCANR